MADTTLLTDNWSLARQSDVAPNRMKPNAAVEMLNWIPDVMSAPLVVRQAWEFSYIANADFTYFSPSTTGITGSNFAPFQDGNQLVFVDQSGRIMSLNTSGVGSLLDSGGLGTSQAGPGAFQLDCFVLPGADGAHFPWYVSSDGSGNASATAFVDPFPQARIAASWGAYLLMANGGDFANGYTQNLRRLWFSDPGALTFTAANDSYWDFPQVARIMAVVPMANTIIVFGPRDCHILTGDTPPPNDNLSYRPLYPYGLADYNAYGLWNGYIIFANERGVFKTDGTSLVDLTETCFIGQAFRGDMQNFSDGWTCAVGIYQDWALVTVTDGTVEKFTYVFDLNAEVAYNFSGFPTRMYAPVAAGPHASQVNAEQDLVFGLYATPQAGRVQPVFAPGNAGSDANGVLIPFVLQTPYYEMGSLADKRIRRTYLTYKWYNNTGFNETPVIEYSIVDDPFTSPSWTAMTFPPASGGRQPVFVNNKGRWISYRIRGGTSTGVQNLALFGLEVEGHVKESSRSS